MLPLQAAAARLVPGSLYNGKRLRAMLANMACGLVRGEVDKSVCSTKLATVAAAFLKGAKFEEDALLTELVLVLDTDQDGWYRRKPDLGSYLDLPLIAMSDHHGLAAWMGQPDAGGYMDDEIVKDACRTLSRLVRNARARVAAAAADARLSATIGKPTSPLWLTPMCADMKRIITHAENSPSSKLANDTCATLGLSHLAPGCPIVAVVTHESAATLRLGRKTRLAGPTSLEAGGFRHFRHWPTGADASDGYGRTYELRLQRRAAVQPSSAYGVPEAVCPAIQLRDVAKVVYIGKLAVEPIYDRCIDDSFCAAIGADRSSGELLGDILNYLSS